MLVGGNLAGWPRGARAVHGFSAFGDALKRAGRATMDEFAQRARSSAGRRTRGFDWAGAVLQVRFSASRCNRLGRPRSVLSDVGGDDLDDLWVVVGGVPGDPF